MLRPQHRLRASVEILQTIREGTKVYLLIATMYIKKRPDRDASRVACIAGKRVHSSAVTRHAVQRRLRSACAAIIPFFLSPCDMVVVASDASILNMDFQMLIKELYYGIRQGGA